MVKNYKFLSLIFLVFIWSCKGDDNSNGRKSDSELPQASNLANEILVVMDSTKWKGKTGEKLREVFSAPIPGLPQEEPIFTLRYVSPRHFQSFHKLYPNIIFTTILNDDSRDSRVLKTYFTKKSLEQMRQNPEMFMFPLKNEYARGQEVLHLFAGTEEELIKKLEANESRLPAYFLEFERERLSQRIFSGLPNKKISEYIDKKYKFRMEFPAGYEIAIEDNNFIWLRFLDPRIDKNVWVSFVPYDNENAFTKENIIALRHKLSRPYILGNDDTTTYMKTELNAPIHTREVNFKGRYAIETRGLWRLNNMTMGGPFISYTFVDENTNRLYYIEGFVFAAGENKREPVREVEAILHTFKTEKGPENDKQVSLKSGSSE